LISLTLITASGRTRVIRFGADEKGELLMDQDTLEALKQISCTIEGGFVAIVTQLASNENKNKLHGDVSASASNLVKKSIQDALNRRI
jgi:hypothetical protein